VFGIVLEKDRPGVVYDSLGMNGAFTTVPARIFDEREWAAQLQRRQPDLVILNYGTNESGFAAYVGKWYEQELRLAIGRLRRALPNCSLLIMSPMDRAERVAGRRDSHAGHDPQAGRASGAHRARNRLRLLQYFRGRGRRRHHGALVRGAAATGLRGFHPHHAQRGPPGG